MKTTFAKVMDGDEQRQNKFKKTKQNKTTQTFLAKILEKN